ncbi:MAG: response regulator [Deltaproteobacteria bacterium]|nr:response regulator [Deltaproteobacteria bacterium]
MSKILVIDDEESIRTLLKVSLSHKGYEVILAEDGESGIKAFRASRPPIVITDIKMPGMDGIEVLKHIKQVDPDTRIIVITGHGEMEAAIEALQLEASDFINKPVTDEALSVALKRAEEVLWMKQKLRKYTTSLEAMVEEATQELRAAHDFQKNLIESSIDGIIAADERKRVVVFNDGAARLLGYRADEAIGKMTIEQFFPSKVARKIIALMEGDAQTGTERLVNYEGVVRSRDAEEIPVRISGATLFENGYANGMVCFLQDLREIKRLQRELIESERVSAMGQAVAGMAHYIKNILNGLQGGVYMVNTAMKKNKPDLMTKGWAMVENNIGKISDLVMNMLIYSKEREPDYVPCQPNDIAEEVYDLMREKAIQSRVRLVKDFDPSISECFLDPTGPHRCLLNLVANAIDACIFDPQEDKQWVVTIRTRREPDFVRFDVIDNGIGMTEEVRKKVFERFFSTKGGRGTGLGLLVTRKIIDEQGGRISFESQPGQGTTFTMRFPARPTASVTTGGLA